MSTTANKFQVNVAACAIAAAAVITPAVVAQAAPAAPAPLAPVTDMLAQSPLLGLGNLPQDFNWWWVGDANPTPPQRTTVVAFQSILLTLFPTIAERLAGKEICVGGAGVQFAAYGGVRVSVARGC